MVITTQMQGKMLLFTFGFMENSTMAVVEMYANTNMHTERETHTCPTFMHFCRFVRFWERENETFMAQLPNVSVFFLPKWRYRSRIHSMRKKENNLTTV